MPSTSTIAPDPRRDSLAYAGAGTPVVSSPTAVSWGAIFAGAAAAAALSLILLFLGTGLGLSALSPWASDGGTSAKAVGAGTVAWVVFMQLAASALGGYVAGRLRTKWVSLHTEEVAFRDTAHGFLAWAVATLLTAALLTSVIGSILGTGAKVAGNAAGAAATAGAASAGEAAKNDNNGGPMGYAVDSMFRAPKGSKAPSTDQANGEVARIFANAAATGKLPEEDARYAAQLVSQRTGISQQDAEKRVNEAFAQVEKKKQEANEAADAARKASAAAALILFISLLIGAFVASYAATIGGRQRDD